MPSNEILEKAWRIKDKLWKQAGGDIGKFCDQLREWADKTPMPGPVLRTPEEIRRYMKGEDPPVLGVREDSPQYGD